MLPKLKRQVGVSFMNPIGYVRSCYREKFGIPRQPGLVTAAKAVLTLDAAFNADSVRGLEAFSHVWLVFQFHATEAAGWKPTVRPPRLGGNERVGVFASRSMFRPNPIGLSVVKLDKVQVINGLVTVHFSGADLLNGTPILDIKPYLPYADVIPEAQGAYAANKPDTESCLAISFSTQALQQCESKSQQWQADITQLIRQILQQDPRPAYHRHSAPDREYGMRLYDFDVRWRYQRAVQVDGADEVFDEIYVLELVTRE